jgi:hypothetical protein
VKAGELKERERIISNIYERISDLRSCTKKDNCVEFGELIEEYVFEWADPNVTAEYESVTWLDEDIIVPRPTEE